MTISEFEKELQVINKDLAIRPNTAPQKVIDLYPDVVKLASVTLRGVEVCTIPNGDIYDEPSGNYGIDLRQDGRFVRHRTRPEALQIVKEKLSRLANDKEYYQDFFGIGPSSDAELRKTDEPVPELVEEVTAEATQIVSGTLEAPHEA